MLAPYVGLTGKALLINIDTAWLEASTSALLRHIDVSSCALTGWPRAIASAASLLQGSDLVPLPLLGISGWSPENEIESYYDDAQYFRAGRRSAAERDD